MATFAFDSLRAEISDSAAIRRIGRVDELRRDCIRVAGLSDRARLGDRVVIRSSSPVSGEIVSIGISHAMVVPDNAVQQVRLGDAVDLDGAATIAPDDSWIGRLIDPMGAPLDGRPLFRGPQPRPYEASPPPPAERRHLGSRIDTGIAVLNTLLPVVRGQRIGLFAGSGVGKSTLLGMAARGIAADVVVIALIGERGREVRDFIDNVLGPAGMARAIVVAATSDQPALVRRRCAQAAMSVAEHFRDQGRHVLYLADSITRLAEAHREVAVAAGEPAALRGFPASTAHRIMSLAERAGPGRDAADTPSGDITAIFSVLVAGSDMDEPVADILRGVLDGHVVLDRAIAERGRYPAIDLLRSVSRSLPRAASDDENRLILRARAILGAYDRAELMIQAGLYVGGTDPQIDEAIRIWPALDAFLAEAAPDGIAAAFDRLRAILQS